MTRTRFVGSFALPACAALVASLASTPAAHAQTNAAPARAGSARATGANNGARIDAGASRNSDNPGSFREVAAVQTGNVGAGAAATTSAGPTAELRGATAPAPDQITGPIGPGDAARLVQSHMPQFRLCYETARATSPRLAGRVEVRFTIGRDGRVTQAMATGMPEAPDVATCVANVLRQTTFPRPEGGSLPIIYPLNFAPPPVIPARGRRPAATTSARATSSAARAAH